MIDAGTLSGIVTAVLIVAFVGGVVWLWGFKRRKDFESAARLPLDDDGDNK